MSVRVLAAVAVLAASVLGPAATLQAQDLPGDPPVVTAPVDQVPVDGATVAGSAMFVPVTPTRVLDTRSGLGSPGGPVRAGTDLRLAIVGSAAGVPGGATAVVLNLTVTEPQGPSFVTVFPDGESLPNASSANVEYAGQTVANLVTARLGGGAVRIFTQTDTHLVVDVSGYYVPAATATSGRFQTVTPTRLLDTREANPVRTGALAAGEGVDLDIAGRGAVPRTAVAAVLTLTATEPTAAGYVSVTPRNAPLGEVSNLNVAAVGDTVANQVVVPLQNGWVTLYTAVGTHLLVDLNGWYTGPGSGSSGDGLFVPLNPGRLLDTRDATNSPRLGVKPGSDDTVDVVTAGRRSVPASGVAAVVVNATVTDTDRAGFFTLFGAGLGRPLASNVNANRAGQTVPNHAVVPVSTLGLSFYSAAGAHLIVDVAGYFAGTTPAPLAGYVTNNGASPTTGPHTFLYQMTSGYARWNPCSAITYQVNYSGAPAFARTEVDRAVAKVEAATGLDLVNLGDTTAGDDRIPPPGVKAVIDFVSPAEAPAIQNVAGLGGGSYYTAWNGYDAYVAQGFVHINETLNYSQGTGPTGLEGLLLHEIGHMVGLDHVDATTEVMYPVMHNLPYSGYGPGDREGLWNLGAAKGCLRTGASDFATQSLPVGGGDPGRRPVEVVQAQGGATDGRQLVLVSFCGIGPNAELQQASRPQPGASELVTAVVGTRPNAAMLTPGA